MKRVTIEDVAAAAGVSRQTVSRAMNNKGEISAKTRERVLQKAKELGYRPSRIARGMATQSTFTVGLALGDITNAFFSEVARGVQDGALENDYNVFLANTDDTQRGEMRALQSLREQEVDGIIAFAYNISDTELHQFADSYAPILLINRHYEHEHVSSVFVDIRAGARQAIEYLISQGHRKIAMLTHSSHPLKRVERYHGYAEALQSHNLPIVEELIIHAEPTPLGGYRAAFNLLQEQSNVSAIFAYNDLMAVGALRACFELGLSVPGDCAVVGFDGISLAQLTVPSLTTVQIDKYELGSESIKRLFQLIQGINSEVEPTILDAVLQVRESA